MIDDLRSKLDLMHRALIRLGHVSSVDAAAGTVVIDYPGDPPPKSHPMPWFQRGTEHRPPSVGDHALVIDPSLGFGQALAITGWSSTARPPADGGGDTQVIFKDPSGPNGDAYLSGSRIIKADDVSIQSPDIELGVSPTDYAALAAKVDAEFARIWDVLTGSYSPAPPTGGPADAGEPGLITLKILASTQSALVQSVAASQVKVK